MPLASSYFPPGAVCRPWENGGAPLRAAAYAAHPDRRLSAEQPPSSRWLATVIRGARAVGLPADWIAELEAMGR